MTFNSVQFFILFAVVLALYFRLGMHGQNRLVVAAGAVFYGSFDWRFLGLLYFSTVVDYGVARGLDATENARTRRTLIGTSLVTQIGILGFFKYANFFSDSAESLLESFGLRADMPTLNILLPVGISFYTFQTLAYVLMVYRGRMKAERNLITFAAFVSWFPQMVAGPIERPQSLLPQIQQRRRRLAWGRVESGAGLIIQGLLKKVMIADAVAPTVNEVFGDPDAFGWHAAATATLAFALQVYGDFSGYSDCARGVSRLLGVELRRNFEQPFLSRNIQEFWQRWHTSLGWWFLEFVGRPLGRVRRSQSWTGFTMLVMFTLIGLWHGAAWTFVFWGLLNGVLVVIWRRRPIPEARDRDRLRWADVPHIVFTFGLFCLGAVFFRAASFSDALSVLNGMVTMRSGRNVGGDMLLVLVMAVVVLVLDIAERRRRVAAMEVRGARTALGGVATEEEAVAESLFAPMPAVRSGALAGAIVVAVAVFSGGTPTPFIYFQF